MVIYSEKTKKKYESVEACMADEALYDAEQEKEMKAKQEMEAAKEARAKEIADAYEAMMNIKRKYAEEFGKARDHYYTLVKEYNKDYSKPPVVVKNVTISPEEQMANILSLFFGPDHLAN